jgi:hypothetical protein
MMPKNDKNVTRSGHCERSVAIQPIKMPLKNHLDCSVAALLAMTAFLVPVRPA